MVKAMLADGLAPTVLSSYRSYFDQAVAHNRWLVEDPANANENQRPARSQEHHWARWWISVRPNTWADCSTTDPVSPLFDQTSEGRWLAKHAFEYGFSMSSPPGAQLLTGWRTSPGIIAHVGWKWPPTCTPVGCIWIKYLFKVRPVCLPALRTLLGSFHF